MVLCSNLNAIFPSLYHLYIPCIVYMRNCPTIQWLEGKLDWKASCTGLLRCGEECVRSSFLFFISIQPPTEKFFMSSCTENVHVIFSEKYNSTLFLHYNSLWTKKIVSGKYFFLSLLTLTLTLTCAGGAKTRSPKD